VAHHTGLDGQGTIATIAAITLPGSEPRSARQGPLCYHKLRMGDDKNKQHGDPRAGASPPGRTASMWT
jgi:hypothetical protein